MNKLQKVIILLLFATLFLSCNNTKEIDFEKDVMSEIYPNVIDSIWIYNSISNTIPFVKLGKNDKFDGYEPIDENKLKIDYNGQLAEIKKGASHIFTIISDTIYRIGEEDRKALPNHFKSAILVKNKEIDTLEYSIDREEISAIKYLKVKFVPEFKMEERPWETNDRFNIPGVVSFSRIQFDKDKKYGVLTSSIACGGLCGNGYRIFIKRIHNKWVIDKFEETWIS